MDFRQYNNDIGRFVTIDPITHFSQSPYHFANNNPMYYSDPSGMDGEPINTWHYAGGGASNSFLNGGAGNLGMPNPFAVGTGSAWGDGGKVASYYGNGLTINLDWGSLDLNTDISFSKNGIHLSSNNDIAELLPEITLIRHKSGRFSENAGELIQNHVYENGSSYQFYRDARNIAKAYAIAQSMQDIGDGAMVLGTASVLTGYGAVVGAGMIEYGGYLSTGGTILEIGLDIYTNKWTAEKIATKMVMEIIPETAKKGFKYLGAENAYLLINLWSIGADRILDEYRESKAGPYFEY